MSELAKVLRFPAKQVQAPVSSVDGAAIAAEYLSTAEEDRSERFKSESLSNCDVLLAICKSLRDSFEAFPAVSAAESASLYRWVLGQSSLDVVFDEREYLLGETA